jgi:hypothetical protein
MQTAIAEILLQGDMLNTATKRISAAEVPILRSIHGSESITKFSEFEVSEIPQVEEIERLERIYGSSVRQIYSGVMPRLITTFSEVGVDGFEPPAQVFEKKSKLLKDN